MRVLVTGPQNEVGAAVVQALAAAGHEVRAFGVPPGVDPFPQPAGAGSIVCFPGDVALGGSAEPVAVECSAIVHAAAFDAPGADKRAHAIHIERGALYTRYAAERELVGRFIALLPAEPARAWSAVLAQAESHVLATKALVPHVILRVASPQEAAQRVLAEIAKMPVPAE